MAIKLKKGNEVQDLHTVLYVNIFLSDITENYQKTTEY